MPAYRSEAEGEIRGAVVARLREIMPDCRIIHEINACGGGNRIDVLAVTRDRIAAVEIKSARDKLDRLPEQIKAMRGVAHHVFAALHEKFLKQLDRLGFVRPDEARGASLWVYPRTERKGEYECGPEWNLYASRWDTPRACLPPDAIHMLWREELVEVARACDVPRVSQTDMPGLVDAVRWRLSGRDLTLAICGALRARAAVEADDPVTEAEEPRLARGTA